MCCRSIVLVVVLVLGKKENKKIEDEEEDENECDLDGKAIFFKGSLEKIGSYAAYQHAGGRNGI